MKRFSEKLQIIESILGIMTIISPVFGWFSGNNVLFVLSILIVLVFLLYVFFKKKKWFKFIVDWYNKIEASPSNAPEKNKETARTKSITIDIKKLDYDGDSVVKYTPTYHHYVDNNKDVSIRLNITKFEEKKQKSTITSRADIYKIQELYNNLPHNTLFYDGEYFDESGDGNNTKIFSLLQDMNHDSGAKFLLRGVPETNEENGDTSLSLNVELSSEIFRNMFNKGYIKNYKDSSQSYYLAFLKTGKKFPALSFLFNEYIIITKGGYALCVAKPYSSHIKQVYNKVVLAVSDEVAFASQYVDNEGNNPYVNYKLSDHIIDSMRGSETKKKFNIDSDDVSEISLKAILMQKMTFNSSVVSLVYLNLSKQQLEEKLNGGDYNTTYSFLTKEQAKYEIDAFLDNKNKKSEFLEHGQMWHPSSLHRLALWINDGVSSEETKTAVPEKVDAS